MNEFAPSPAHTSRSEIGTQAETPVEGLYSPIGKYQ